jgi:hypothetical protein
MISSTILHKCTELTIWSSKMNLMEIFLLLLWYWHGMACHCYIDLKLFTVRLQLMYSLFNFFS